MSTELNELQERLQTERQQLAERLNEVDNQLTSIDTVFNLLKKEKSQFTDSQIPLLEIKPTSVRLSEMSFKGAVNTLLKDDPLKWWKPKELFYTMLKEGFKSNSKDFNNVARNMLMHMRKKVEVNTTKAKRGYMYSYLKRDPVPHMAETGSKLRPRRVA